MITTELSLLRDDGYVCALLGDLNSHIGNDDMGIVGIHRNANSNGTLVRRFLANNELTVAPPFYRRRPTKVSALSSAFSPYGSPWISSSS